MAFSAHPQPATAGQEAAEFPGSRLGWHNPGLQGKPRPSPCCPALPGGRPRMNGLGRRAGAGPGVQAPGWLRWAALGCGSPFGRGPSPLKPFVAAGCSFLLPPFSAFSLSPDRKPPAPPSHPIPHPQAGLGNRGALEGMLCGQSWERGSQEAHLHENGTSTIHLSL